MEDAAKKTREQYLEEYPEALDIELKYDPAKLLEKCKHWKVLKYTENPTPTDFAINTLNFKLRGSTMVGYLQMLGMEWQTVETLIRLLL